MTALPPPIISIWSLTYNHEKYLARALDSMLMQQTEYPFEIVIHDDCSTDGTIEILKEYAAKYPDIVKPIYEEVNQCSTHRDAMELFGELMRQNCRGKYIASLEGDDYWIDPLKLQKQVSFMEKHPEIGFVASYFKLADCNGVIQYVIDSGTSGYWNIIEKREETDEYGEKWYLCGNVFEHAKFNPVCRPLTMVFRKDLVEGLPFFNIMDIVFHGIISRHTEFAMLAYPTAVHCHNEGSITHNHTYLKINVNLAVWMAKARFSFKRLYPDVEFFSDDEISDRLNIVKLKRAIYDGDYRKAREYKGLLKTPEYKNSFFSKNLRTPLSMLWLRPAMMRYLKK